MFKPGLILVSGGLALALGGCGMFDGVDSVVRNLSGAADKNQGSYRAPLAVPPDYNLRPPPKRAAKKVAPAAKPDADAKAPETLDTAPTTAAKTDTTTGTKAPDKTTSEVRPKGPSKLVIDVPDRPDPGSRKVPAKTTVTKKPETKRVVVTAPPPPPQPSETTGKIQPETRGKEDTSNTSPSSGEDELLRKSGVKP